MKILGILGSHRSDGATDMMLETVLSAVKAPNTTDMVYLEDYPFKPDQGNHKDPVLDELEQKMLDSDVWVIAAPTYWGGLAGKMKDFFLTVCANDWCGLTMMVALIQTGLKISTT